MRRTFARSWLCGLATVLAAGGGVPALAAGVAPPLLADSFRIGDRGQVCEAQGLSVGPARHSVYDRRWALLCREVARPVGTAWFVRDGQRPAPGTGLDEPLDCSAEGAAGVAGLAGARVQACRGRTSGLDYRSYRLATGRGAYVVEGLAAYDSALVLALRSLSADRLVPGEVTAASLGTGGGSAFFQANGTLTAPASVSITGNATVFDH